MKNEFENIHHIRINDLYFLLVDIEYRKPHLHFDSEIALVLEGSGTVKTQKTEFSISAGSVMIFNSCQIHKFRSDNFIRLLIMQFNQKTFEKAMPQLGKYYFDSLPLNLPKTEKLAPFLLRSALHYFSSREGDSLASHAFAELALYELTNICKSELLSDNSQSKLIDLQGKITDISEYIQMNYNRKLSLEELGNRYGFSRSYFSHFFKSNFGTTFKDYIDTIRCEKAYILLHNTKENLLSITYLCGFVALRIYEPSIMRLGNVTV